MARNRAEGLVFTIEVDPTTGKASIREFAREAKASFERVKEYSEGPDRSFSSLATTLKGLAGAFGGLLIVRQIQKAFERSIATAAKFEVAEKRLEAALRRSGDASEDTRRRFIDYARQLAAGSSETFEATQKYLSLAVAFGATGERARDLVAAALDLAAATGTKASSAVRNLALSLKGVRNETLLLVPGTRALTQEELAQGDAIRLVERAYGGAAKASSETLLDAQQRLAGAIEQTTAFIGKQISEALNLRGIYETLAEKVDGLREAMEDFAALSEVSESERRILDVSDALDEMARSFVATGQAASVEEALEKIRDRIAVLAEPIYEVGGTWEDVLEAIARGEGRFSTTVDNLRDTFFRLQTARLDELLAREEKLRTAIERRVETYQIAIERLARERGVLAEINRSLDEDLAALAERAGIATPTPILEGGEEPGGFGALVDPDVIDFLDDFVEAADRAAEAAHALSEANRFGADRFSLVEGAAFAAVGALASMARAGKFSAKALVNAIASQTFGTLSAIAIEAAIRSSLEHAKALAAAASGNLGSAALHEAAAAAYKKTALSAGAGAAVALGISALTAERGGAPGGGGGAAPRASADVATDTSALGEAPREQRIFVFFQNASVVGLTAEDIAETVEEIVARRSAREGRS